MQIDTAMSASNRIEINPEIMLGKPVIRGTRITVELLLRSLSEGATEADLLEAYPRTKTSKPQWLMQGPRDEVLPAGSSGRATIGRRSSFSLTIAGEVLTRARLSEYARSGSK